MRYLGMVLLCVMTAGCFEGPTGPAGPQGQQGEQGIQGEKGDTGEQGEQGEPGDPGVFVESWTHTITSSETTAGSSFAVVVIEDERFEYGCDYKFWKISDSGEILSSMDMVFDGTMIYYMFLISDGRCVFTAFEDISGNRVQIFKYRDPFTS